MDCSTSDQHGISWSKYATKYDELVVPLPCYQDNIRLLTDFLEEVSEQLEAPRICDVGAGTGIYIQSMASILPDADFLHVDRNTSMCAYAKTRYERLSLPVQILNTPAEDLSIEAESLNVVTAVNSLYTLPSPEDRLKDIYSWLEPGGYFFAIDFGRRQDTIDWTKYFFKELFHREGIMGGLKQTPSAINLFRRQNEGVAAQDSGDYWIHTTEEFELALVGAGFEVIRIETCYRGYADLGICIKPYG